MSPATAYAPAAAPVLVQHRGGRRSGRLLVPAGTATLAAVLQLLALHPAGSPLAAAAWAGSRSGTAWFLGTFDTAGAVGVSGPPASLWVEGLSVRLLGLSTASLVLPLVLESTAAVALLTAAPARRRRTRALAGVALAVVLAAAALLGVGVLAPPVALAGVVAAGCVRRAARTGHRRRWLVTAGLATAAALLTDVGGGVVVAAVVASVHVATTPAARHRVSGLTALVLTVSLTVGAWAAATSLLPPTTTTVTANSTATSSDVSSVVPLLAEAGTTWSAAVVEPAGSSGPQWAAQLQLASSTSVLPVGGTGPTVGQFQAYVATGRLHYLLVPAGAGDEAGSITAWVAARYSTVSTADTAVTVYDLTVPLG